MHATVCTWKVTCTHAATVFNLCNALYGIVVVAVGSIHLTTNSQLSHLFMLAHVKREVRSLVLDRTSVLLCICSQIAHVLLHDHHLLCVAVVLIAALTDLCIAGTQQGAVLSRESTYSCSYSFCM
jgi:hypothetical protein